MSPRSYTIKEIDELRYVISVRRAYGSCYTSEKEIERNKEFVKKNPNFYTFQRPDNTIYPTQHALFTNNMDQIKEIEMLLRTYMLAGATAQDIFDADKNLSTKREVGK